MVSIFIERKVRGGAPKISNIRTIEVLLGNAGSDDSRVALIVESARLRARTAEFHEISPLETRERAI